MSNMVHAEKIIGDLRHIFLTERPAALGPSKREGTLSVSEIDRRLETALPRNATPAVKNLIRATLYLWHDHLDDSHRIAQDIETADGSLIHGIMHRREPDYSNAKYWFRRVGHHPSFLSLALKADELLKRADENGLHSRLLPNKTWDPYAFVDAVEDAHQGQFRSATEHLEQIQRLEFESLLENLAHRVAEVTT